MSQTYRQNFIWTSSGGQLRADLASFQQGFSGVDRYAQRSQRGLSMWGQQVRALQTTIRYALAGGLIYGVVSAISSLGQFEGKLGEIDAIAAQVLQGGNLRGLGDELQRLGDDVIDMSTRLVTPVDQLQTTLTNFYSSFEVTPNRAGIRQAEQFTEIVTKLARVTQTTDIAGLTNGLSGMVYGFGGGQPASAGKFANMLAEFVRESVGYQGEAISRDIGRLSASAIAGNIGPAQMLGIVTAASKGGGSSAVISRGVAQLLSNILIPNPQMKKGYQAIGLPTDPTALRQMGGWEVLRRMMERIGPISLTNRQALVSGDLTDEEAVQMAGARGTNLGVARQLFPRVESFRQFLNLLNRGRPSIEQYTKNIEDAGNSSNRLDKMFDLFMRQNRLNQAQQAWKNFSLQFVRNFDPVLQAVSSGVTWFSRLSNAHHTATRSVALGLAGTYLGGRLARSMGVGRMLGRLGRFGRIAQTAQTAMDIPIQAALATEAMPSVMAGIGQGTRQAPLWVIIHPLSWAMPGTPAFGGEGGGGTPGFFGKVGWRALLSAGTVTAVMSSPYWTRWLQDYLGAGKGTRKADLTKYPELRRFSYSGVNTMTDRPNAKQSAIIADYVDKKITAAQAEKRLEALNRHQDLSGVGAPATANRNMMDALTSMAISGEGAVVLQLKPSAEMARLLQTVETHIPVKLWNVGGGKKPTHRAQKKTTRGGH